MGELRAKRVPGAHKYSFPANLSIDTFLDNRSNLASAYDVALLPITLDEENSAKFEAHLRSISGEDRKVNFPTITEKAPFAIEDLCKAMQASKDPNYRFSLSFRCIGYEAKQNALARNREGLGAEEHDKY